MTTFERISFNDIPLVLSMMREFYAIDNYPIDPAVTGELIKDVIAEPALGSVWLIYKDGHPAGYIVLTIVMSFEYGGRIGFLDELYIAEQYRQRGIGKEAVHFIQDQADKLSLKVLYLEVEPHNEGAQKLYIAAGFSQHARALMRNKRT